MRRLSSGRDSFEPEMPRSTYSLKTSHPRREAYSRNSAKLHFGALPVACRDSGIQSDAHKYSSENGGGQLNLSILRSSAESQVRRHPMLLHVTDPNPSHSLRRARIFEGDGHCLKVPLLDWPEKR